MIWIKLLAILCLIYEISAFNKTAQVQIGKCLDRAAKKDYEFKKYEGTWYAMEVLYDLQFKMTDCYYITYKNFQPDEGTFEMDNVFKSLANNGAYTLLPGKGRVLPCEENCAKLEGDFYYAPIGGPPQISHYDWLVLDTDYQTYSVEWCCSNNVHLVGTRREGIYILLREPQYALGLKEEIYAKLQNWGFDTNELFEVDRVDCKNVQ